MIRREITITVPLDRAAIEALRLELARVGRERRVDVRVSAIERRERRVSA